ncbi:MAG: adenylate kinase [Thermomicrobiales bacterium]
MHVILMGAQGSGKGTQAERLVPQLHLEHLSTGNLFRAAMAAETALGRQIKPIYDHGDLIPDDITLRLVEEQLEEIAEARRQEDGPRGALFDGFPRTRAQAEGLGALLTDRAEHIAIVVEIQVPTEVLVRRLAGRRVCSKCGATYHVDFDPPKQPGVCDRCGGELLQRADDTPEGVQRRLDLYFEQTAPLLAYYRERELLVSIDGNRPVDDVTADIVHALGLGAAAS